MNERFDPSEALRELAEDLGEGPLVNWDEARERTPGQKGTVEGLHLIQRVADAHRSARMQGDELDPTDAGALDEPVLFNWGPLQIIEMIGEGGFADVYRAWDPKLQRQVALKLRREDAESGSSRWMEEARRLAGQRHPNVLVIHGSAVHDQRAGIWTDLIRGRTLAQWVTEGGALGAREAAIVGIDLCMALSSVHESGLVHGDVKASNVMRESGGRIVLMDFGSGHRQDDGLIVGRSGTPLISAPELMEGGTTTTASDIYAMGVLLYWLVSLEYPFEAESVEELRESMRAGRVIPLRDRRTDLPNAFVQIVDRAMAMDPRDRWKSPAELEAALAGLLSGSASSPQTQPAKSQHSTRYWLLGAALVILVLVATLWSKGRSPDPGVPESPSPARLIQAGDKLLVDLRMMQIADGNPRPLEAGSSLSTGMRLALELSSSEPADVYVLNEDEHGELFVLFPVDGVDLSNPLDGGRHHLLPGRIQDKQQSWVVTSSGGTERFLVVVARDPLPHFERAISEFRRASAGRFVEGASASDQVLETLRGVGGMSEVDPEGTISGELLPEIADALVAGTEDPETLWVWYFSFPNPAGESDSAR